MRIYHKNKDKYMGVKIPEAICTAEADLHVVCKIRFEDVLNICKISGTNKAEVRISYSECFQAYVTIVKKVM